MWDTLGHRSISGKVVGAETRWGDPGQGGGTQDKVAGPGIRAQGAQDELGQGCWMGLGYQRGAHND